MKTALTGKDVLDALAASLTNGFSDVLAQIFGPGVYREVIGPITWADLGVMVCFVLIVLILHALAASILRGKIQKAKAQPEAKEWHGHVLGALGKPLYLLIWVYGIYFVATPLLLKLPPGDTLDEVHRFLNGLFAVGVFVVLFWLFFRFTHVLDARLEAWAGKTESKLDDVIAPLVGRSLRVLVPVIGIILALPVLDLPQEYAGLVGKGSSILLVVTVAWVLFQGVHLGEKAVLAKFDITAADNLEARKVYTQVHVISKTLYFVIILFTVASILMLFEEVRRFGTSLLASAGLVGVVAGFAARSTIANLFAGFQLAVTQPIRLDDVVIVEGEWGRIEEITLTYVVVHIWDDRRLIVPLSHFIEQPFQNWTRVSAQLLGSIFLWVDYTLPLDKVREALKEIVETNPLWDRRFWNLQVTDTSEKCMQIRVLATAADSSKAWDLRCDVREKLIAFIQRNYPQHLPRLRGEIGRSKAPAALPANRK